MVKKVKFFSLVACLMLVAPVLLACRSTPSPTPVPAPSPKPAPTAPPKTAATVKPAASPSPSPTAAAKPAKPATAKPAPITIGIVHDTSGFSRDAGTAETEASILAIEEWNARGGAFGGAEIKYIARDNAGDPAKASTIAREFIQSGVVAVVGGTSSTVAIPESKLLTEAKIPYLAGSAAMEIFQKASDGKIYAFTASGTNALIAEATLHDMAKKGYKRIAFMISNVAWPKDLLAFDKELIAKKYGPQNGIQIVHEAPVDVNATDLNAEVVKLKAQKFDAVNAIFYPANVGAYVKALASAGWRPPPKTYMLWDLAQTVWNTSDKSLFAGVRGYTINNQVKPEAIAKKGAYMTRWGREPRSGNWTMGYDNTNLLLKAIDAAGRNPGAIREHLETKIKGSAMIGGSNKAKADFTMDTLHSMSTVEDLYVYLEVNARGELVWD